MNRDRPITAVTDWVFERAQDSSGAHRLYLKGRDGMQSLSTSAVVAIDVPARIVTTRSGTLYRLDGPWVYAHSGGAPETLADILAWYGDWTPAEPRGGA